MVRVLLFVPMLVLLIYTFATKPKNVAYFESYWTFLITVLSLFLSMMAHFSKWFHSMAVFTSELSMCFNICVVPCFWIARYPDFVKGFGNWNMQSHSEKLDLF